MANISFSRFGVFYVGRYLVCGREVFVNPPKFCQGSNASENCDIRAHSKVTRKCGPAHQLIVFVCKTHRNFMRIYPEGWRPYAREGYGGTISIFTSLSAFFSKDFKRPKLICSLKTIYRKVEHLLLLLGCRKQDTESDRCNSSEILGIPTIILNEFFDKIRDGPLRWRAEALISLFDCHDIQPEKILLCASKKKCCGRSIKTY